MKENHVELYLAAMRYERDAFAKQSMPELTFDESYTNETRESIQRFISNSKHDNIIMTTEGLSLLRHEDELGRLKSFFTGSFDIRIVLYLRNRIDFLNSYRKQLDKKPGRSRSNDYWSALYVEDDTWLTDYDAIIEAYGNAFGADHISIIDYDEQMQQKNNIIPAFIEAVGIEIDLEDSRSLSAYLDNRTLSEKKTATVLKKIASLPRRAIRKTIRRG